MIFIAFGRWNHAAGKFFIRQRIYWKGYIWTPLVRVRLRYGFWQSLSDFLPRDLVYFAAIRLIAYATTGKYGDTVVPDLLAMDAVERWRKCPGQD